MVNYELLRSTLVSNCLLLTADCPLPTAFCRPPSADRLLPTAFCRPPSADCLLNLRGVRVGGTLGPRSSLGRDVLSTRKEETVVTLKMTDRRGNVVENKGQGLEATGRDGNVIENKGSYALKAGMLLKIKELHGMS